MKVAVIGGGAAGFFAAISCKIHHPASEVTIYEKTGKLLSKVKISGGGRCNVTHACFNPAQLSRHYPRGEKQLKKAFAHFSSQDTVRWFEQRGVPLKTEADNRMFPTTDDSQTIIDCLMRETQRLNIKICTHTTVDAIEPQKDTFRLLVRNVPVEVDKVIVATGGSPKLAGLQWLADLGHKVTTPVPSLFTFNMPKEKITALMGVSVAHVQARIEGIKQKQEGALLITHWGMSGPVILKLSSWEARSLFEKKYMFKVHISWTGAMREQEVLQLLQDTCEEHRKRKLANKNPFQLPQRLWLFLLEKVGLQADSLWGDLGKKSIHRLLNILFDDVYEAAGKTTFKEEFVTCGGVSLQDVSINNMESRICPGMYFAGEVLDMDGITGGFNFQAAWTTGYIAGMLQ